MKATIPALAALCLLTACGKHDSGKTATPAAPAATNAAIPVVSSDPGGPPPGNGITGVLECDVYIDKLRTCLATRIPAAQRAVITQTLEQNRQSWITLSNSNKAAAAAACQAATNEARSTYAAIGCAF